MEQLTPTSLLNRAAAVHADRPAVIDGPIRRTYRELRGRCLRQAGMLNGVGRRPGDRIAVLAANGSLLLESHFGVLYAGCVLVTLNTRLSANELAHIVEHAGCSLLLHDRELAPLAAEIAARRSIRLIGPEEYERLLRDAPDLQVAVDDERALMALNYTSGTTGQPKGVMYHHRGAYLQSLAMVSHFRLDAQTVYLWTLPMFHCNGWCFPWAVTAAGGTHVCLPRPDPAAVWTLIERERVNAFCGAPTVLSSLINSKFAPARTGRPICVAVGGAPPTPSLLRACDAMGLQVTHLYGLTETFGPAAICDWLPEWDELSADEQSELRARQGVANLISHRIRVVAADGTDVPADGRSVGEVAMRGNNIMLGYYRDEAATAAAVPDGWFRTGDLGVLHPNGYLQLTDRAKDIIVSGGENISSIEVEAALCSHPDVLEAAVVAVPDARWGERPVAWVTLHPGRTEDAEALRRHVRDRLAGFKVPDRIEFGDLPKTGSGKIRKVELRDAARGSADSQDRGPQ